MGKMQWMQLEEMLVVGQESVGGCGAMDPISVPLLRTGNVGNHK